MLAAATGAAELAFAIFPITFLFFIMFAGFTIRVDDVPPGWSWAVYVSYPRWVFEGLMVNAFGYYGSDGQPVLDYYDFGNWEKGNSFYILILFTVLIMLATYYFMRPAKSYLTKMSSSSSQAAPITESTGLNEKLVPDSHVDPVALAFPTRSTYDVQWYRSNTGDIQTYVSP